MTNSIAGMTVPAKKNTRRLRPIIWGGGILAVILLVIFVLAYLIDEPLRRKVEREMNARLKGYTVRIEELDFHPIGLSLDLEKLWIYQTPQPDPPIAYVPNLHASVHWKALLSGRLVGDFQIHDPQIHFDLRQFVQEAKDPTPIKDKGWQDALAAYPLKIDRFAIRNGDLTSIKARSNRSMSQSSILPPKTSAMLSPGKAFTRRPLTLRELSL